MRLDLRFWTPSKNRDHFSFLKKCRISFLKFDFPSKITHPANMTLREALTFLLGVLTMLAVIAASVFVYSQAYAEPAAPPSQIEAQQANTLIQVGQLQVAVGQLTLQKLDLQKRLDACQNPPKDEKK